MVSGEDLMCVNVTIERLIVIAHFFGDLSKPSQRKTRAVTNYFLP